MAVREPKDLLTKLADAGEEAFQRLSDTPGADRLLGVAHTLRDRVDEMQKRLRGLDAIERRVAELERRVDELSGTKTKPPAKKTTGRKTTARKTTATKASTAKRSSGASSRRASS